MAMRGILSWVSTILKPSVCKLQRFYCDRLFPHVLRTNIPLFNPIPRLGEINDNIKERRMRARDMRI